MPFHQTSSYPSVGSSASASLSIFDPELTRKISNLQEIFLEQKSKIDELDDPLSIFDSYHAQLAQLLQFYSNHPDTTKFITSILVPVLDSATQTFARDPRYRNDPRYLKLWLSYAKYCREAEDIFVFLSQEGIAQELANFYEEYALLLTGKNPKQANLIYQKGIDRKAQPLERLKKKYAEFELKHRHLLTNNTCNSSASKAIEVRGYDSKMIHEGDFSFEEIRAKNWYAKPKISKPTLTDLSRYRLPPKEKEKDKDSFSLPTIQNVENYVNVEAGRNVRRIHDLTDDIDDEEADLGPGLGIAVNPDDLTHINVFKDNTADLREIAKLVKANKSIDPSKTDNNTNANTPKKKSDWFLKDLLMSFSPIRKKPHLEQGTGTENFKSSENSPISKKSAQVSTNLAADTDIANVSVSHATSPMKATKLLESMDLSDIRLLPNSIPDIKTDVTMKLNLPITDYSHLMDPFDLDFKIAQCEAVLAQIASAIPNLILRLDETAGNKVRAFEKSLGRDGSGPNHTVSSLRMASGHFFMEKKLGEGGYGKVFLAVDLMKDDESNEDQNGGADPTNDVNQVAIKIETPASVWESYIIFRIQSHIQNNSSQLANYWRHFPRLISASIYSDVSFLVMDYYEQGSLLGALNVYRQQNNNLDEAIILFYASELIKSVIVLHEAGILHTDIKLENLLILTPRNSSTTTTSIFKRDGSEGWSERGLVLIDFGRSVDLKLLKDEEGSRFFIKSKHQSFNGSPRISQRLDISHEMDWYGVADCLHWLLHQKPLLLQNSKSTKLANSFKRYWQTDIWEPLFDDLLNPSTKLEMALEQFKGHLDRIWNKLEGWKKTPSLKSLLTRQEIMLYENKK